MIHRRAMGMFVLAGSLALALLTNPASAADNHGQHGHAAHAPAAKAAVPSGDPYLLATDPVTGELLGKTPVIVHHESRELRFASQANADQFKTDPKTYLAKVDKQLVQQQLPHYAMNTCLVSGDKLAEGETVNYIHNNRLVRFCCESCINSFTQDPAKFLKQLDETTIAAQKANYPLTTCVVGGGKLGTMGEPADLVVGNRLIRLCCGGCKGKVQKDPVTYLTKLDEPAKK